ncbi:PilN domain-containing protein, partial [Vibrio parahaemolyticus]
QGRRPGVVHVFDELVRVVPDGVYFKSLDRKGDVFTIHGVAETKNEVSNLMRNLDASPWFQSPQLSNVVEVAPA